jgi:SAM-dependent methyltransferase
VADWLADPVTTPPGRRAVVVGCGTGEDAALLASQGYDVTAFDVAPSAVALARRRHRGVTGVDWRVADLLTPPDELVGAFDLVVEVEVVTWLPGVVRDAAMHAVGRLTAPGGVVLAVTLVATDLEAVRTWRGPPWAQAPSELAAYRADGLVRVALEHAAPADDGAMAVRLTFQRPHGAPPGSGGLPVV